MSTEIKNLLPIGTVVRVKEANKKMMIIGILQQNKTERYDYMAILHPEGFLSEKEIYMFNHEDIEEVNYLGFMDSEFQAFRNTLIKILEENNEDE